MSLVQLPRALPAWLDPPLDLEVVPDQPEDRAALQLARRSFVGGSDVAAILGQDPDRTPFDVWLEKRGDGPPRRDDDFAEAAELGTEFEPVIAMIYGRRQGLSAFGWPALSPREFPFLRMHADFHLDGLPMIGEVKNRSEFVERDFGQDGTSEVPERVLSQVCFYLALSGAPEGRVTVAFGGNRIRAFTIENRPFASRRILDLVVAWCERHLVGNEPVEPTMRDGQRAYELSQRMYPRANRAKTIAATGELRKLMLDYMLASALEERASQRVAFIQSKICEEMGSAYAAETHDLAANKLRLTWGEVRHPKRTDWAAVCTDFTSWLQLQASSGPADAEGEERRDLAESALEQFRGTIEKYTRTPGPEDTTRQFKVNKVMAGRLLPAAKE